MSYFQQDELCIRRTREVNFARYNKKSKALLLLLSLLFFSSLNSVEVVCASISHSHLCKHQNSALALSALSLLFHFRYGL
jgi:hypothetical protein